MEDIIKKLEDLDRYEVEIVNSGDDDNSPEIEFTKSEHYGEWIKVQDVKELIEELKLLKNGRS